MSFGSQLDAFHKKTMEKVVKVKRLSAFDLFSAIVLETPVDKGVLRNNWFAQIGRPSAETTSAEDKSGRGTVQRIQVELTSVDLENDIYFTNNLVYAVPIEFDGLSGKAPQGMVRINALRWDSIVNVNARRLARE